ncbi:TIM barrel protein [Candidatus Micrarchaeota archaeon]|nr:TIM barrel protein [Candidatus Micrarchaeota archaeon]MBU1930958.1 TIM barrel protein [Candidatus Micrarchaeota archaeon]
MTSKILFGTAGIPLSTSKPSTITGIERVKELELHAMELEFVRGVNMKKETAKQVKKTAEKNEISLSVHGPYYINLNSKETTKQEASIKRIFDSAEAGEWCGAKAITFHPGFFQGMLKEKVTQTIQKNLEIVLEQLKQHKIVAKIKPETTGKPTQYGSLTELLELYSAVPAIKPYVDFAHVHARDNGRFKTKENVRNALEEIEKNDAHLLKDLNMHFSGIAFSEKGEKNHLVLQDSTNTFPYKWVLECLKEFDVHGTVICESPNIEKDALLLQKYYEKL